ncbi:MAG: dTDP-4-dehydrorhamnose reductase [Gammaproteobacteria bacterium]|nr:dTDP-4-dehydrorhamnose reductase [Gammaproteobacteria bacterium]
MRKRVLITGANGQLGWELKKSAPADIDIIDLDSTALDIRNQVQVKKVINETFPDVVINGAAYTAVDKAEQEPELAYAVNAMGAGNLAVVAHALGVRLIHLSTDFVFDGRKSKPYLPDDLPNPLGVYGASKLEGERLVTDLTQGQALILRTSWVYSIHGQNFVKTMLELMREREKLSVISDQVGTPTWAKGLAQTIWRLVWLPQLHGIYCWTDAGVASWYDFAVAIQQEALRTRLLERTVAIRPIVSDGFQTAARRPAYSVLDKTKTYSDLNVDPIHWRTSLSQFFEDIKEQEN